MTGEHFVILLLAVTLVVVGCLWYRDHGLHTQGEDHEATVKMIHRWLLDTGLLPRTGDNLLATESPVVRLNRRLEAFAALLDRADTQAALADLAQQVKRLETLRLSGPTVVQLDEADQARLDNLPGIVSGLAELVDKLANQEARTTAQTRDLGSTADQLHGCLEQLEAGLRQANALRTSQEEQLVEQWTAVNNGIIQLIGVTSHLADELAKVSAMIPPVDQRPLRLSRALSRN